MRERILAMISQIMEAPAESLNDDSSPATVESWDSLKHMSLVLSLEEEFGIRLTDEQIMRMNTIRVIVETVSQMKSA